MKSKWIKAMRTYVYVCAWDVFDNDEFSIWNMSDFHSAL